MARDVWRDALGTAGRRIFSLYLAGNMTLCALLFFPWVEPRETLSGFFGRQAGKSRLARAIACAIDLLHWWEPEHCYVTFRLESELRARFYSGAADGYLDAVEWVAEPVRPSACQCGRVDAGDTLAGIAGRMPD